MKKVSQNLRGLLNMNKYKISAVEFLLITFLIIKILDRIFGTDK